LKGSGYERSGEKRFLKGGYLNNTQVYHADYVQPLLNIDFKTGVTFGSIVYNGIGRGIRPEFNSMIADREQGKCSGIVVQKLDRFRLFREAVF